MHVFERSLRREHEQGQKSLGDAFGIFTGGSQIDRFKQSAAEYYVPLYEEILIKVLQESVLHVDETTVNLRGGSGYVWVLTTMDKVYYFYRPSREGSFLKEMLAPFKGVLISDFYAAYDTLPCTQQKCIVHFVRDIDDDLLRNPLDTELKCIAQEFGTLLRVIIRDGRQLWTEELASAESTNWQFVAFLV